MEAKKRGIAASALGSAVFFGVAPGVVAGLVPGLLAGWRIGPPFLGIAAVRFAGVILLGAGAASLLDCFARFTVQGHGTPAPVAPTDRLVVSGQYRYVRNPMYVAVVGAILGQGLLFGSARVLGYGVVVWSLFHLFVLAYEEPTLARQFGESYRSYRIAVRRWWPRLEAWHPSELEAIERAGSRRTSG